MKTVKDVVNEWCLAQGYKPCEEVEEFVEVILDCNDGEVWADSYLDHHRWYYRQEKVVKLGDYFISVNSYNFTGDACMSDMDLEYTLEDFTLVEKKTRTVEETYYE